MLYKIKKWGRCGCIFIIIGALSVIFYLDHINVKTEIEIEMINFFGSDCISCDQIINRSSNITTYFVIPISILQSRFTNGFDDCSVINIYLPTLKIGNDSNPVSINIMASNYTDLISDIMNYSNYKSISYLNLYPINNYEWKVDKLGVPFINQITFSSRILKDYLSVLLCLLISLPKTRQLLYLKESNSNQTVSMSLTCLDFQINKTSYINRPIHTLMIFINQNHYSYLFVLALLMISLLIIFMMLQGPRICAQFRNDDIPNDNNTLITWRIHTLEDSEPLDLINHPLSLINHPKGLIKSTKDIINYLDHNNHSD